PVDLDRVHRVTGAIGAIGPPLTEADLGRPRRRVAGLPQHRRTDRRSVHEAEMVWVDGVFGDHLWVHLDARELRSALPIELVVTTGRDVRAENLESIGRLPRGFTAAHVVPDVDRIVLFRDGVRADPAA